MRWCVLLLVLVPAIAGADAGRLLSDHTFDTDTGGELVLDAGLVAGLPSALPAGLSTGIGAGITRRCGCVFSYGARASWSTVSAPGASWLVTQDDFRFRLTGAVRHDAGRGSFALRLGLGPTIVHEVRDREQGMRAGLTGTDLQTRAIRALPAADLEAVISLKIAGQWLLIASGGPSVDMFGGSLHAGWTTQLGVAWNP
jgi:hypothetical protein